jgi:Ca2+-binding EF-hand superfamily protein
MGALQNCPNGLVTAQQFEEIFGEFFYFTCKCNRGCVLHTQTVCAASTSYARLVFRTFDHDGNGVISFDEFVDGLSTLLRGSEEQRLRWIFQLYDEHQRGFIDKQVYCVLELTPIQPLACIYRMYST